MSVNPAEQPENSLKKLDVDSLFRSVSPEIVNRGRAYYRQGRAKVTSAGDYTADVDVNGSEWQPYQVRIKMDPAYRGRLVHIRCDCPYASHDSLTWCKHKVAAVLAVHDYLMEQKAPHWAEMLEPATRKKPVKKESKRILYFVLTEWSGSCQLMPHTVPVDSFTEDDLVSKDSITRALIEGGMRMGSREVESPRNLTRLFKANPVEIAAARTLAERWRYYSWDISIADVLPLLTESIVIHTDARSGAGRMVNIHSETGQLEIVVERSNGIRLTGVVRVGNNVLDMQAIKVINREPVWILANSTILPLHEDADLVETFIGNGEIVVPEEDADAFFNGFLPALVEMVRVTGSVIDECREINAEPVPRLFLTEADDELAVELRFGYDFLELPSDRRLPAQSLRWDPEHAGLVRVYRDSAAEEKYRSALGSHGLKKASEGESFVLRANVSATDFLIHHVPKLTVMGYEIYGEENIKSVKVNRSEPELSLSVSSGIDWFDIAAVVNFGDLEVSLAEIRRALRKREKYIKLADGSMGVIPPEWMEKYKYLFDLAVTEGEGLRLSKTQAMLLEAALSEADSSVTDEEFRRRAAKLKDFSQIEEHPLPEGFVGELRHYQRLGYDWLHFLHEYGFGGCLADDMGIGKTVQALVFLQSLKENGHAKKASLIVMPRSLLGNWEREAARFTPNLRVLIHADLDRGQEISEFDSYDLVLTTYGVMLRDIDILSKYRFHCAVLDESQAIKNPLCQTSRAVRLINCDHRLVLTGTPVENSTVELWSQFAFLNPGMLGTLEYFRREFVSPIERKQDSEAARTLRAMVHPFILRRTKELVAPELPPRTERVVFCDLEPAQRKLYDRRRDEYRALLLGMIEEAGIDTARMKVLEGLLRLRQISNHPKLVEKNSKSASAKMEVLLEMLETLQAEGHKALVFSQFTSMLKLVRDELDKLKVPYLYLDGQTRNRQELVDRFQADQDVPFFLISLKAGGVGLNLTAADYVIHIDPWWNPAVERQASDRTHRIGQENPVFVHKLIARDTVEEKMLELQDRKRELVEKLITTESSFFKSLTAQDVRELFS